MLSSQVRGYIEDQFVFFDALSEEIQSKITVRLYSKDYGWGQKARWLDRFPFALMDDEQLPMLSVLKKYRLFIGTYNATAYLEAFTLNFPTVIYWNPQRWEVKPDYQFLFDKLRDVGIFHAAAESAANHVAKIWHDIPGWWKSDSVQSARKLFCDVYLVSRSDLIAALKEILLEEAMNSNIETFQ
jgi:putative transferase (TIGR04331 family)